MASIFILQESGYCRGLPRPYSTEDKANEALDWIMKNEGSTGDSWVIEEHELDFFESVDHPNHHGKKMLPASRIKIVREEKIPLNECGTCGSETHGTICGACRHEAGL